MSDTTWFRIEGRDLPERSTFNVKGSKKWIEQVGRNVRLEDGTRETLRRPQFLNKLAVTITGEGTQPLPVSDLKFGDTIVIDFPHEESMVGEVDISELDYPPAPDRIWYFDADYQPVEAGDPAIAYSVWVPRMTVMLDRFTSDFDDARHRFNWNFEAEVI